MNDYEVIVVGGGHAGCEASLASARMGVKTLLITSSIDNIATTPCNPSIGGPAKGIVVREIDALGGMMGIVADQTALQTKILNSSKGPAVHSLRSQVDKVKYPKAMQNIILNTKNLEVKEGLVEEIIVKDNEIQGVVLKSQKKLFATNVIITTGTYMDSIILKGDKRENSGPENQETTNKLSNSLKEHGFELFRLKTGTPPRIDKDTIDYSKVSECPGDQEHLAFSYYQDKEYNPKEQVMCYLLHTNKNTHQIINENLKKSAMYSGEIKGVGPRYCPSIEDKLVRFSDKERHQLFLEPESEFLNTIYLQGLSTSMPEDIQEKMVHSLIGLENAKIVEYGYAIEYDAIKPTQLKVTLEAKKINGLFFAGQINGTSGYEEAAGQGLVAGANAAAKVLNKSEFILTRMDSYIGLMIDDLVTKGTEEPYRLLTSRSEYRLYLRNDNADLRLSENAFNALLLNEKCYNKYGVKLNEIKNCRNVLESTMITSKILTDELADDYQTKPLKHGIQAIVFLKRPDINSLIIKKLLNLDFSEEIIRQVEIDVKYEGYIQKVLKQISKQEKTYQIKISKIKNYNDVQNLALEAREKLNDIRPETLGHAAQISGITPSDITMIKIHLESNKKEKK